MSAWEGGVVRGLKLNPAGNRFELLDPLFHIGKLYPRGTNCCAAFYLSGWHFSSAAALKAVQFLTFEFQPILPRTQECKGDHANPEQARCGYD
jgi:hypothetical protein